MQVFKFGGASVKSAEALRNMAQILKLQKEKILVVVSAMDKITNALEKLFSAHFNNLSTIDDFEIVKNFHLKIINDLFEDKTEVLNQFNIELNKLGLFLENNKSKDFDFVYDQIVSFGEIFSTIIISHYLNSIGIKNKFLDARQIVLTDYNYRYASILTEQTQANLQKIVTFQDCNFYIIQGFIGTDNKGNTTTLGREGSDYSASTFANLLNAQNLTLWKDVAGIYNADPKIFPNALKLNIISYREATELAYFGAKIIHPKTARPLMLKNIPLYIRSFKNPAETGTNVQNVDEPINPLVPIYIFNPNQVLVTIYNDDFIDENLYEQVYSTFKKFKTKINLIQNSALNLSVCFDFNSNNFNELINQLKQQFQLRYNTELTLLNIRHYQNIEKIDFLNDKQVLMEQKSRLNAMFLYK